MGLKYIDETDEKYQETDCIVNILSSLTFFRQLRVIIRLSLVPLVVVITILIVFYRFCSIKKLSLLYLFFAWSFFL